MAEDRVCLGVIVGAHGVRGLVKVKSFTETPEDVAAYGPVSDRRGARRWSLDVKGPAPGKAGDVLLVRVEGVDDREAAQALHGTELFVDRAALPALAEDDTFYHADLIGLRVEDAQGRALGSVKAVENYGAGDVLEVERPDGTSLLLAFTRAAVPLVDVAGGRLVAAPPAEIEVLPQGARPASAEGAEQQED
jgi:16S rRNA processing protein RimM